MPPPNESLPRARNILQIKGRRIELSNLDKVLYPDAGFTKGQVIEYYARVAPHLLPHLRDLPITLKRYPNGVSGAHFYEKNAPSFRPKWVQTFPVPRAGGGSMIHYVLINDLPTLVWSANTANLELHPFLHTVRNLDRPTSIVFDLDPGEGASILESCEVALLLKEFLAKLKLNCLAKVSGSKGIHVHVPLNTAVTYAATRPFARTVAQALEAAHPELIISEMTKTKRRAKVFIDWSQNTGHKTTVAVYSLRAKRGSPYVAMPVTWNELDHALAVGGGASSLFFEPSAAIERLEKSGDLFAPLLKLKQRLPESFLKPAPPENRAGSARRAPPALQPYVDKRDFTQTPEPPASIPRTRRQGGKRSAWRWINTGGSLKPHSMNNENASALTARSMAQIAASGDAARRSDPDGTALSPMAVNRAAVDLAALPRAAMKFVRPMMARTAASLPDDPNAWMYEVKFDGYRCLALKQSAGATLFSRRGNRLNEDFPEIAAALAKLPDGTMIDGEIVALDERGRPSFNALQNRRSGKRPLRYYVFDLLAYQNRSLLSVELSKRRELLRSVLPPSLAVVFSEHFETTARRLLKSARELALEGIIAKRADSLYEPGKRSGAWVKYKIQQGQEFVVGGYKVGNPLESLLIGYHKKGKLIFLDTVRNGLTRWLRKELHKKLAPLEAAVCPFTNLPERKTRLGAVTKEEMKNCRWIQPAIVAQIEFAEWTVDGHLRHPKFAGLREDKGPEEVVLERP